jgi:hypothetical protein
MSMLAKYVSLTLAISLISCAPVAKGYAPVIVGGPDYPPNPMVYYKKCTSDQGLFCLSYDDVTQLQMYIQAVLNKGK